MFARNGVIGVAAIGMLLLTGCGDEESTTEVGTNGDEVVAGAGDSNDEITPPDLVQGGAGNGIGVELPADPISRGDYNQSAIDEAEEGKTVDSQELCWFAPVGYSPFYAGGQSQDEVGVSMAPNMAPEFYVPISDLVATGEDGVYILDEPEPMHCDLYAVAITTVRPMPSGQTINDMIVIYQHAKYPDIQVHERVYPGNAEMSIPLPGQPVVDLNG